MPRVDYRLQIEGCPVQWVTSEAYAGSFYTGGGICDTHTRLSGLSYEGQTIDEQLKLRDFDISLSSMTVKIKHKEALEVFTKRAKIISYLTASVNGTDTGFNVLDNTVFSNDVTYHLGTEAVKVTSSGSNPISVARQQLDTQTQAHYQATGVHVIDTPIYDGVPTFEGRRCYLFMYLDGEESDESNTFKFYSDITGATLLTTDRLIWRGVIIEAPILDSDGLTWLIKIEPNTVLLEQELSGNEDAVSKVSGIYHSHSESIFIYITFSGGGEYYRRVNGFFTDENELISAIQVQLDSLVTEINTAFPDTFLTIWISGGGAGSLTYNWTMGGTVPGTLLMYVLANAEGEMMIQPAQYTPVANTTVSEPLTQVSRYGPIAYPVAEGWNKFKATVPRGWFIPPPPTTTGAAKLNNQAWPLSDQVGDITAIATYPNCIVHYDGAIGDCVTTGDEVLIKTPAIGELQAKVAAPPANNIIVFEDHPDGRGFFLDSTTTLEPVSVSQTGTVADFLNKVCTQSYKANGGNIPFVTHADVADWTTLLPTTLPNYLYRIYKFLKPAVLRDVLREELKLAGYYICLGADGRIIIRELVLPISTTANLITIDADDIITPYDDVGMWPKWTPNAEGIVSDIVISDSYDWEQDSSGEEYHIKDEASIAIHKNRSRGTLKITPKSTTPNIVGSGSPLGNMGLLFPFMAGAIAATAKTTPGFDLEALANKIFGVLAQDYEIITIKVPFSRLYDSAAALLAGTTDALRVGTEVKLTSAHIPDSQTGTMGVTNKPGLVIGRKFPLDPAEDGCGEITIWIQSSTRTGGYAPACRITNAVLVTGNTWELTVTAQKFAPDGVDDCATAFFLADMDIEVMEYDTIIPLSQTGYIESINYSAHTVTVVFDGAAPWGGSFSGVYDLKYDSYDVAATLDPQKSFTFVADTDGTVFGDDEAFALA
jgi:hypothetical protein